HAPGGPARSRQPVLHLGELLRGHAHALEVCNMRGGACPQKSSLVPGWLRRRADAARRKKTLAKRRGGLFDRARMMKTSRFAAWATLALALGTVRPVRSAAPGDYFRIEVIDQDTGRG